MIKDTCLDGRKDKNQNPRITWSWNPRALALEWILLNAEA
jgi:hypothetical protein